MISFVLLHLAPGEPFAYDSPYVTPAIRAQWREQFGYNRPLPVQLARYVSNVARGQFGYSTLQHRPARDAIAEALPRTLILSGAGLIVAFLLGGAMGMLSAARQSRWPDRIISAFSIIVFSIPDFWLALIIQLAFAFWIRAFPVGGPSDPLIAEYGSRSMIIGDRLRHLVLPLLAMSLLIAAIVSRFQRAALLDVLPSDYIRTARAKGLAERTVITRHALRNAL